MTDQGKIKPVRKAKGKGTFVFIWHTVIVIGAVWLLVSQILAVMAIRFMSENYSFVPRAEVQTVDVVLSPLAE